jgi:cell division protease FtsH
MRRFLARLRQRATLNRVAALAMTVVVIVASVIALSMGLGGKGESTAEPQPAAPAPAQGAEATADPVAVPTEVVSPLAPGASPTVVPYREFVAEAEDGGYRAAVIDGVRFWVAGVDAQGRVAAARLPETGNTQASSGGALPSAIELPAELRDEGVIVLAAAPTPEAATASGGSAIGGFARFLLFFLGATLFIYAGFWLFRRLRGATGGSPFGGGSLSGHGKSRGGSRVSVVPSVRFSDVAGCDEAVDALSETIAFLKDPERFGRVGARMPKGLIMHGPPGTGKTLLAKATAGEAGVPFYETSGSEFVEMYVGVGASRVRDLFKRARQHPDGAIVFIDEIDAIGQARGGGGGTRSGRSDQERDQTLNQLLSEMDGFGGGERVVVMASTNRLELLDDALLRPGRFDRHIQVDFPNREGRRAILEVHARSKSFTEDGLLDELAATTAGSSGADLENLLNEAAIMAALDGREAITRADLTEGHLRAVVGRERADGDVPEDERRVIAWHEAGHALAAELCPTHTKAQRVTIVRRGKAMGLAFYPSGDKYLYSPQDIFEQMIVGLAGRAAEEVVFGQISSGAANDLEQVNEKARGAIQQLGFSGRVGQLITHSSRGSYGASEETRTSVDAEVARMVAEAYSDALRILGAHRDELERLAIALLVNRQLDRAQLVEAIGLDEARSLPRAAQALMRGEVAREIVGPPVEPPSLPVPVVDALADDVVGEPAPALPPPDPPRARRRLRLPVRAVETARHTAVAGGAAARAAAAAWSTARAASARRRASA